MKLLTSLFVMVVFATSSLGQNVWDYFQRSGPSESFYSPFDRFGGTTSQNQYTGFVVIGASGVTSGYPGEYSDAFWTFISPFGYQVPYYSEYNLCYSFNSNSAYQEGDGRGISKLMAFIDGVGYVQPWTNPDYTTEHRYLFVVDVGPDTHFLTLGSGDGGTWDNSGGLNLSLWQVASVPESSGLTLLLAGSAGFVAYFFWQRCRRRHYP